MKFRFSRKAKAEPRVIPVVWHEPKPIDPLTVATGIARKAKMTNAIYDMSDTDYALLITMKPNGSSYTCRAHVYPENQDPLFYSGLEDVALRFLYSRNGQ